MFEDAHYRWKDDPVDGEYELQFDRFETSAGGYRYDQAVLLIVDREIEETVGQVVLPTAAVAALDPAEPNMTRIFHSTIEDGNIVEMKHDPELSKQRHEKMKELYEQVRATPDNESESDG